VRPLFALALAAAACDPVYAMHLHARVTSGGAPVAGAWILAPDGAAVRGGPARTGADGTADVDFSGRSRNPAAEPLAIAARDQIVVALPGADFVPRKKGFFGHAWESTLEVALEPRAPLLHLGCTGGACRLEGADPACAFYELSVGEALAEGRSVMPSAGPSGALTFVRRHAATATTVVALCAAAGTLRAFLSNAAP
jgi:hypothetical protein